MKLETKYSLGDKVYAVWTKSHTHKEPCNVCDSSGRVNIPRYENSIRCPECNGAGHHLIYEHYDEYYISYSGIIGQVEVEITEKQTKITYMIDSTGIGSGTLWDENRLFLTEKEALDYCNAKNIEQEAQWQKLKTNP